MTNYITVKGARVHNLKNIDVKIPKNKLIVITGVSGSGKSSLAFDTIFAEGQRRYVESLSPYARQFLGIMDKPDVDLIDGLSPAISVDQKTSSGNPRSTVGTTTEIYDYLRLLYARVGEQFCYQCGNKIKSQSVQEIVDAVFDLPNRRQAEELKVQILSPVIKNRKGTHDSLFETLSSKGFSRVRINYEIRSLDEDIKLEKNVKHSIEVVVDRLILKKEDIDSELKQRVTDSIETALRTAEGEVVINLLDSKEDIFYSEKNHCVDCGISYPEIEPHSFSFNSPYGACQNCNGIGSLKKADPNLVYNPNLTIKEGAIFPWSRNLDNTSYYMGMLKGLSNILGFSLEVKMKNLDAKHIDALLYGSKEKIKNEIKGNKFQGTYYAKFEGIVNYVERRYRDTESDFVRKDLEQFMVTQVCPECNGARLRKESLAVKIAEKNITDVTILSISNASNWIKELKSTKSKYKLVGNKKEISEPIIKEIENRLGFLMSVGLKYLTLNRTARSLSGGESQRIRLASQIGSGLSGVLYVLDEPSIGLHQRDNNRLIETLKRLRDIGNTVLVVEHDEDTILEADEIIDMGPAAGIHGGEIVAQGNLKYIKSNSQSVTAPYLNHLMKIGDELNTKRSFNSSFLTVHNASKNNLKNISVKIPLGKMTCVTGVSGSGKSTLVNQIIYKYLSSKLGKDKSDGVLNEKNNTVSGWDKLKSIVLVDQSPIGRTPRSNPATYTGFFASIREIFANTKESKYRGYTPGRFSFNVKGGRCETCKGDGVIKIEMQFLPDIYVECETCRGKRYNRETLEVQYKGKNISEVLELSVDEAKEFFNNHHKVSKYLNILSQVGLGYIKLGQQATTLSGGEAQRIKLASELSKRQTGTNLYILDEPTTGLHFSDVDKLLKVMHELVANGNSMIVIEHNLDVIKTADWIVDLGPEGGDEGGEVIFEGNVKDILKCNNSYTGRYLKQMLNRDNGNW